MSKEADELLKKAGYTPHYWYSQETLTALTQAIIDAAGQAKDAKGQPIAAPISHVEKLRRVALSALEEAVGSRVAPLP